MQRTTPLMVEWVVEMWKASNWCNKPCYLESMTRLSGSSDFQWCNSKVQCDWLDTQIQKKTTKPQQQRSHFLLFRPRFEFRYDWTLVTLYLVRASTRLHNFWWYYLSAQAENKLKARTCPILCHNEIHGTSQYVDITKCPVLHCKTVTILLRIRVRGHFVTSITKNHESHYVTVLDTPLKAEIREERCNECFMPLPDYLAARHQDSHDCEKAVQPAISGKRKFGGKVYNRQIFHSEKITKLSAAFRGLALLSYEGQTLEVSASLFFYGEWMKEWKTLLKCQCFWL